MARVFAAAFARCCRSRGGAPRARGGGTRVEGWQLSRLWRPRADALIRCVVLGGASDGPSESCAAPAASDKFGRGHPARRPQ